MSAYTFYEQAGKLILDLKAATGEKAQEALEPGPNQSANAIEVYRMQGRAEGIREALRLYEAVLRAEKAAVVP